MIPIEIIKIIDYVCSYSVIIPAVFVIINLKNKQYNEIIFSIFIMFCLIAQGVIEYINVSGHYNDLVIRMFFPIHAGLLTWIILSWLKWGFSKKCLLITYTLFLLWIAHHFFTEPVPHFPWYFFAAEGIALTPFSIYALVKQQKSILTIGVTFYLSATMIISILYVTDWGLSYVMLSATNLVTYLLYAFGIRSTR